MDKEYKNLEDKIKQIIYQNGPLTIEDYMSICLQDEEDGYYKNKKPIGRDGDFITAPEISQMFGEMIGIWLITVLQNIGNQTINLIELGPGNGYMMNDIQSVSRKFPDFSSSIKIWLYDISNTFAEEQSRNIRYNYNRIDTLEELPVGINFFIANEFFDAIPIKQFIHKDGDWKERAVDVDESGELSYSTIDKPRYLNEFDSTKHKLEDGLIHEISPKQDDIFKKILKNISRNGGLLIIDYAKVNGGAGDTLQAISKHKKKSIFYQPGDCDLTSLIDTNRFTEIAKAMNVGSFGPINQNDFLLSLGIFERYEMLKSKANNTNKDILYRQYHRLIDSDKMGELFKVLYFTNNKFTVPERMK